MKFSFKTSIHPTQVLVNYLTKSSVVLGYIEEEEEGILCHIHLQSVEAGAPRQVLGKG